MSSEQNRDINSPDPKLSKATEVRGRPAPADRSEPARRPTGRLVRSWAISAATASRAR
jgi:hypothetical protein